MARLINRSIIGEAAGSGLRSGIRSCDNAGMDKTAIIIVTYKRQQLLDKLLESLLFLDIAPWRVYVVDNEASTETERLVKTYAQLVGEGFTAVPWAEGADSFIYAPQPENTGGAGGFSEGVRLAYEAGAEWFWLMDDDVKVTPDALTKLEKWSGRFDAIQGSRLDYDGGPFWWQYRFLPQLGAYNPLARSGFGPQGWKPANALCFEGGFFSRRVVDEIGLPDARFFIYWDDCIYGYLASRHLRVAVVEDVILQRTRNVQNWEVSGVRQLNSSSDMTRYHVMRNRGHVANYLKAEGELIPVAFAVGTASCAAKELIRLAVVERGGILSGAKSLLRGWRDSRAIMADPDWKPYKEL
ncbi:MAG: glycosyltransferase [Eggerthellaceae bacterium]|nr:glycosyltransferase [Eggerthellaceae bacterium]